MIQPLWRTVWRFFKKLKIELPYDPAIPVLCPEKTIIQKETCTAMFFAALFTIARTWKQPKCPSTDEWIKKTWHICTMEYYSAMKRNEGFPGGAVVGSPPANAGDTGSCPGLGRSHMPRSGWAPEPQLLSLRSVTGEAATVGGPRTAMKSGPRLPQLEKALAQKRRPNPAKNK